MNRLRPTGEWIDRTAYPFKHRYIELKSGTMHYVDEGEGEVIVFVHGTPTWSFLYRNFIKALSKEYRTIAVDHIGFGLSEKPEKFEGQSQDHAKNLSEFIQKLDLTGITLVVHDFGGPIGLAAGIHYPERIKRVVLFNTWLWETASSPAVNKLDRIVNSFIGRTLYLRLNFSPRILLKKGFADDTHLSKEIHRHYIKPFPDKTSRLSLYRIAQSLKESSKWYQKQWEKLGVLETKPWLILWGMEDKFITPDFLERWEKRLPRASVHRFDCGHFVQEEETENSVGLIREFLRR